MYFLKLKYNVFENFKVYKALVKNAYGNKIKVIMIENGKDYVNNNLQ